MGKDNRQGTAGADLKSALTTATADQPAAVESIIESMLEDQKAHLQDLKSIAYGTVECNAADGAVYEKFGRKSCAAIECMVSVPALGLKLPLAIWARLAVTPDGTEITFEASAPKGAKFIGDGKEMLLAHVENAAAGWPGYDKATASAEARLMGQKQKINGADGNQISRPKLVKRVVLATARDAARS
jgi:hypothetical protein